MVESAASLLVFSDDWGRHPSSCQHLIQRLLPSHPVWWVNTIGMRPPRLNVATLSRGCEKIRQWFGRTPSNEAAAKNPTVVNPRMWPWVRRPHDRWINRSLLRRSLRQVVHSMPGRRIAVTTVPVVADLMGQLPVDRWAYYCVDDFGVWPGLDHKPINRMEHEVIENADLLIAVSETLQDKLRRRRREVHLLTHGVDLAFWRSNGRARCEALLAQHAHPRVVFWGVIDLRLDVARLRRLAADMATGQIILVGPMQDPDPALLSIPRVAHVPAVPLELLPSVAAQADVLVMPYRDLPVTRAIQPLKLKEYMATGKSVIVSDLPATRPWQDCLDIAGSPEEFSAMVRARVQTGPSRDQLSARRRLEGESWAAKAEEFRRLLVS
jgi:glycosyltransferase involved in cell wall biosynthesis